MIARGAALAAALIALGAGLVVCPQASRASGGILMSIDLTYENSRARRPERPVNDLVQIQAALADCWKFPPVDDGRSPVDVIFELSFKRSGELFGKPRVVKFSREVSQAERERFNLAVVEAVDRCSPMPFTDSMGGAVAGRVLRIRFIDSRKRKQVRVTWPTEKS
jgi:hypothetical protein